MRFALILSLLANLTLATLFFLRPTPSSASSAPPLAASASTAASPTSIAAPTPRTVPAPLAPDDFAGLAARLADAGVPSHYANVTLNFAIKQHFERRRLLEGLRPHPANYTRNPITNATSESAEIQAARRAVDREEQDALRAAGLDERSLSSDAMLRLTGKLPADKANRLLKIVNDYRQIEAQLYLENPDRGSPANRERVALLQKEQRADIERLLTPEELLDYDLRSDAASGNLRNRLGHFPVSDAEFRALHAAFKAADTAANANGVPRRARERDAVFEPEFRRVLGEARYADLERTRELEARRVKTYTAVHGLVKNFNLPSTTPNDLLILQAEFSPLISALHTARTATPEQRETQLAAATREAERRLAALLGPDAFAAYRQTQGRWLAP